MKFLNWLLGNPDRGPKARRDWDFPPLSPSASYDDADDQEPANAWQNHRFKDMRERRPPGMVILDHFAGLSVAGTQHRLHDALDYIHAANSAVRTNGSLPVLVLEREPGNAADKNAVRVIGVLASGRRVHIGYLPSENAQLLAAQFLPDMPIMAELKEFGSKTDGSAVFLRINVLGPKAADRKKFQRT